MDFGVLNEHTVGFLMMEWVLRAIHIIREERFVFEIGQKEDPSGNMTDLVTSVDRTVQAMYVENIRKSFPDAGILAEETLDTPLSPIDDKGLYFTIDPLDGTRAFIRRQSHGIGTMLSLVKNGKVVAAFVGDVMAGDVYGFPPGSKTVWRYSDSGAREPLLFTPFKFSEQYILLRDAVSLAPPMIQALVKPESQGGIFEGQTIDSGSIGIWVARLWKGEYGAAVLPPSWETPWDNSPLVGISERMGFELLGISTDGTLVSEDYSLPITTFKRDHYQILIHRRDKRAFIEKATRVLAQLSSQKNGQKTSQ